jgi:hypothetical protein
MRLHRFRFSGKITTATSVSFPGFAGHRPAFHGGFCVSGFWWFSAAGDVPAELPISCDLRRFVQSENGWYYCALGRSKSPSSNQGTTSRSTPALLKP